MKQFPITDLARIIKAHCEPAPELPSYFTGVNTDSRTIKSGDCFFAIRGDNFDGHDYLSDAFAKGAVCAVVDKTSGTDGFAGKIILKVDDTIEALGLLAAKYRSVGKYKVVAITGSVGKTTTRQIVFHVLSRHFHCCQSPKNFNNNIGLPLTLLGADASDKVIIAELGTNHPGEIAYLAGIAQPDVAVVTNIYPAHLEGFGDLQEIMREKLSIAQGLRKNGILIVNADFDSLVDACRKSGIKLKTFGKSDTADIQARSITYKTTSSEFTIDGTKVILPLPGPGNIENALAAWAVCCRFEISIDDFAQALMTLPAVPMRAELLRLGSLTVLNDCYNANPASMINALSILTNLRSDRNSRLVFVCGDMAELGRQSEKLHAELGASIAKAEVQLLLTVGQLAQVAADAAKKAADYDLQTNCFPDAPSLCNKLKEFVKDSDIILIKGSRIAKLETVVRKLKELFPE